MPKKWNKQKILQRIKARHIAKESLRAGYMNKNVKPLFRAAITHFGSWRAAIEAAGFNYENDIKDQKFWSKKRVEILRHNINLPTNELVKLLGSTKASIRYIKKKHGIKAKNDTGHKNLKWSKLDVEFLRDNKNLRAHALGKLLNRSAPAIQQKRISLGLVPDLKWNKKNVLNAIKARIDRGLPVTAGFMHTEQKSLYRAAVRIFGTWSSAISALGINYEKDVRTFDYWNHDKILSSIRELEKNNGSLSSSYVQKNHRALYVACCKHIGSWEKAVRRAGFNYKKYLKAAQPNPISAENILKQIRDWHRLKEPLNPDHIGSKYPNFEAQARRRFGTWKKAIEAAGYNYGDIKLISNFEIEQGRALEDILKAYFEICKPHYLYHYRLNRLGRRCLIPDFYDRESNVWIDCKLRCWSLGVRETLEKYSAFASEVHIYYLFGKTPKETETVKFFNIRELISKDKFPELHLLLSQIVG